MSKLFLLGGGEIGREGFEEETTHIDSCLISDALNYTEKRSLNILFIPTASRNSNGYIDVFKKYFSKLCNKHQVAKDSKIRTLIVEDTDNYAEMLEWADIIYVGGGNTAHMMRTWDNYGFSDTIKEAFYRNDKKIFGGNSAGAGCWFQDMVSDSLKFSDTDDTIGNNSAPMTTVRGLGVLKGRFSPHITREREERVSFIHESGQDTLGLDDRCAVIVDSDGKYKVIKEEVGLHLKFFSKGNEKNLPDNGILKFTYHAKRIFTKLTGIQLVLSSIVVFIF